MAKFTGRTVMAPVAAFSMACIVYAYTRSSIHAAKMEVADRRRKDGGGLDLRRESLRKRGLNPDKVDDYDRDEQQIRDLINRRT
ncbi:hypothetical protein PYCC9005_003194 [Savitreella phatthalungensis]